MIRNFLVGRDQTVLSVDDKHDDLGRLECAPASRYDEFVERILARTKHPARVNEGKRKSLPLSGLRDHIARRPGYGRDDRPPRVRDSIEECRLSHVWPTNQDDGRGRKDTFMGHSEI
jgi:hypothetical protein